MTAWKPYAICALAALAGALSTWLVSARGSDPHAGLAIGMEEGAALAAARKTDPAAFLGQVCGGGPGVVAYVRHLGMEWMLMAHLWHGRVREVMLFRNAAADTRGWRHCETAFSNVIVAGYKRNHPAVPWTPRTSGTEGGERWARISGLLPDGTPLSLEARRAERLIAQCTFEVAYGPGGGGKE